MSKNYWDFLNGAFEQMLLVQESYDLRSIVSCFEDSTLDNILSEVDFGHSHASTNAFEQISKIVPYIPQYKYDQSIAGLIQHEAQITTAQLLQSVVQELNNLPNDEKAALPIIAACFVVVDYFQSKEYDIWPKLSNEISVNGSHFVFLNGIIRSYYVFPDLNGDSQSVYERRVLEEYRRGIERISFSEIYQLIDSMSWRVNENLNYFVLNSVEFLFEFDLENLVVTLNSKVDSFTIHHCIESLSVEKKLELSLRSSSLLVQFACLHQAIYNQSRDFEFSSKQSQILANCLIKLANESNNSWKQFLSYFNQFPSRYSCLQKPLGKALSRLSDVRISEYVDSLEINQYSSDPQVLNICLTSFLEDASDSTKLLLYSRVFEKWNSFMELGLKPVKPDIEVVLGLIYTDLKDAVIFYLQHFCNESDLFDQIATLLNRLSSINTEWFDSLTSQRTMFLTALSKLYIYGVALNGKNFNLQDSSLKSSLKDFLNNKHLFHRQSLSQDVVDQVTQIWQL